MAHSGNPHFLKVVSSFSNLMIQQTIVTITDIIFIKKKQGSHSFTLEKQHYNNNMPYFFKIKSMKEQNLSLFTEHMNSSRSEKERFHLYVFVCHNCVQHFSKTRLYSYKIQRLSNHNNQIKTIFLKKVIVTKRLDLKLWGRLCQNY